MDGFANVLITRAAAHISDERLVNLIIARMGICQKQAYSCHDEPRGAIPALDAAMFNESLLNWVKLISLGQTLNSGNLFSLGPNGQVEAGIDGQAVNEDRTGATFTFLAVRFGAGQSQILP